MSKLDSKIKKIIQNEGFTNDEIFYADYDSFEEIPLFSRWKSIAFLKKTPFDENNKLLILHAVKLAEHAREIAFINTKEDVHKDFFCCVTLTKWDCIDEINCITPNIYITRRRKWLFTYVKLKQTSSEEEMLAMKYINELGLTNYSVYISEGNGNGNGNVSRVYIINNTYG
ncbi:Imm15 family immunity protein [Enterobacter sp. 186315]